MKQDNRSTPRAWVIFLVLVLVFSVVFDPPIARADTGCLANRQACDLPVDGAMATTWHVPGDYSTIQAALDASTSGDTVLVGPGTYTGNLNFNNKDITLKSDAGAASTKIIGTGSTMIAIGPNGKISGFTITGGSSGGGISVTGMGTVIEDNVIENQHVIAVWGYYASARVERNVFRNNSCMRTSSSGVVSFLNDSSPVVINNLFINNSCEAINTELDSGKTAEVVNNTIIGNGTGIRIDNRGNITAQIYRNNLVFQNTTGIALVNGTSRPILENNLVFGNTFNYSGLTDPTGTNGNIAVYPLLYSASQPPYLPQPSSPALDAGSSSSCPALDLRGLPRPVGSGCDIGAYEGYITQVQSIAHADASPTSAASIHFIVTFAEAVTGVDTAAPFGDFALTTAGVTGAAISSVTGSGDTYTVTVNSGTGSGTIRLDVIDDDTILDVTSQPLGGIGVGNGDYTAGGAYTIERTPPTVLSSLRIDSNPAKTANVHFSVTFSEPVVGVDAADFALTTTGPISGASINGVSGSGASYNVSVNIGSGPGTLRLDIPAGASITDLLGNSLAGLPFLTGQAYTVKFYVYLPCIVVPVSPDLYGRVTLNGSPIEGVELELRFYNGSYYDTVDTAYTDVDGNYVFSGVPALNPGQSYYVRYVNYYDIPGQLYAWSTRELTSFSRGESIEIGNFDIGDVILLPPSDGGHITVDLPYTFHWLARSATPSDSYEFDLFDPMGSPYFYTNPPLGYVDSYLLNTLPASFVPNTLYIWDIWVYAPDGGFGVSYDSRSVIFSGSTAGFLAPSSSSRMVKGDRRSWDVPKR